LKVVFSRKFLKDLSKIPLNYKVVIKEFVFEILPNLQNVNKSDKIESLKGYKNYFKARFSNDKVGL
jgi:mRNA interferase RelE/StbE